MSRDEISPDNARVFLTNYAQDRIEHETLRTLEWVLEEIIDHRGGPCPKITVGSIPVDEWYDRTYRHALSIGISPKVPDWIVRFKHLINEIREERGLERPKAFPDNSKDGVSE